MDKPEAQGGGRLPDTGPARPALCSGAAFTRAANRYFELCDSEGRLYSEAGLCLSLHSLGARERAVTPAMLRAWYDDDSQPALRDAVRSAYLRIQLQIETDPRYWEKSGIASRAVQLLSQHCFGGALQRDETRQGPTVQVIFGGGVESSDFQ